MDYGNLLSKAWNTIWNHKFLIGLGVLVALGSGGGGGGRSSNFGNSNFNQPGGPTPGGGRIPDICEGFSRGFDNAFGPSFQGLGAEGSAVIAILIAALCVGFLIGIALWVVGRIAEGGLINGVDEIESGRVSGFTMAWSAGWSKGWRLVGIGLITSIPGILMLIILAVLFYGFLTGEGWRTFCLAASSNDPDRLSAAFTQTSTFWVMVLAVCCPFTLVSWVLAALRAFADRACMTEDKGVLESYGRGWEVLSGNLGSAIILWLIQIALGIGIGILLFIPSFLIALCCLLWPILWLISGTLQAYFSTLWTLAWREWVGAGKSPGEPVAPASAPAV